MGDRLSLFLSDDSGSISAEYALLFPVIGVALALVFGQLSQPLFNPRNRVAVKARDRRRRF